MDKINYFYKAKFKGIPCYFQPETGELCGRNKIFSFLLFIILLMINPYGYFKVMIEHDTVTRDFLEKSHLIKKST